MGTLIFDADDTLWENNVLFERVVDDFTAWLAHPTLDGPQIRALLAEIEAATIVAHGYGTAVFLRCLHECVERLRERLATDAERREIDALAVALVEHRVELMPEVSAVLADLGAGHDLRLLTKGAEPEQQAKIDASGLARHFISTHIVREKDVDTYRRLVAELGLVSASTWMIGNSPRSDILPARAAGLNAVFIPNAHTWAHERAELDAADRGVLRLGSLRELREHF